MLYATARATAETTAGYPRLDRSGAEAWLRQAASTREQVPDLARRYPLSTSLRPLTPDWQENPRAALTAAVRLVASALKPRR